VVFGVFDGLHAGHRALLRQARALGGRLVAVTTHDHVVSQLKGHPPRRPADARRAALEAEPEVNEAVLGDAQVGAWTVLERLRPDVIALGYDQQRLRADLERALVERGMAAAVEIRVMEPFAPDRYKSSLLDEE
jgi:FAD synthetase